MKALTGTVAVSGTILFIIVGATTFSQVLSFSGAINGMVGAGHRRRAVGHGGGARHDADPAVPRLLRRSGRMMLITLPFFMPLVQHFGIDPIWFGVLFLICMQLGLLTPPFGLLLFTMKGVAPTYDHHASRSIAAVTPYVLFGLLMLVLVMACPGAGHLAARIIDEEVVRGANSSSSGSTIGTESTNTQSFSAKA